MLNNLYKHTELETSFSTHMLAIDGGRPRVLSMKDAIACYIEHRREVIIRRTKFLLLSKAEVQAEKLEAYLLALGHLDDFIKIIRDSKNRDEARAGLRAYTFSTATAEQLGILIRGQPSIQNGRYVFTEKQVDDILEPRLYQLTGMERDKVKAEYDVVLATITDSPTSSRRSNGCSPSSKTSCTPSRPSTPRRASRASRQSKARSRASTSSRTKPPSSR